MAAILAWLAASKFLPWLIGAGAVVLAIGGFFIWLAVHDHGIRSGARAAVVAEEKVKTEAESGRRMTVLAQEHEIAVAKAERVAELEAHNADLQAEIAVRSARNDRKKCLDSASVRRLKQIR